MKALVIFFGILCIAFKIIAQDANDYTEADKIAMTIPSEQTNSTGDIAKYINEKLHTDSKKVRAVYAWVIANIQYSKDSIYRLISTDNRSELAAITMRRRKGVCEDFATLFVDICKKCGLPSFVIEGYTRQNNQVDKSPHAWCTVYVDGKWLLYDPTWDATSHVGKWYPALQTLYFQALPTDFIETHMPFDPVFQLLDYPRSYQEFNLNTVRNKNTVYMNYADSITNYEKENSLDKYTAARTRIEKNGVANSMTSVKLSQLKMEIEIIYEEKDSVLYNTAVEEYNSAINTFNNFATYRNNGYKPVKNDNEVKEMFDEIKNKLAAAQAKLKLVSQSKATLILDTGDVEYAINKLLKKVNEQEISVKEFISKTEANTN